MIDNNINMEIEENKKYQKLWQHVLLQLVLDIKRTEDLERYRRSDGGYSQYHRKSTIRKDLYKYLKSEDFKTICDFAEINANFILNQINKEYSI